MNSIPSPRTGSAASSQLELFPPEKSTRGPSKKSAPKKSRGSTSATSSRESASGLTLFSLPSGPTICPSGPEAALASPTAARASGGDTKIPETSGRTGTASSTPASLQSLLESRFQARTAMLGSTAYRLTWKTPVTPSGRSISAQQALGAPKTARGSTSSLRGWPTPRVSMGKESSGSKYRAKAGNSRIEELVHTAYPIRWVGGKLTILSRAGTDGDVRLNREHIRWLQGLPPIWTSCLD